MAQQRYVLDRREDTSSEEQPVLCVPCLSSLHLQGEPTVVGRAVLRCSVQSRGLNDRGVLLPCGQHSKMKGWKEERAVVSETGAWLSRRAWNCGQGCSGQTGGTCVCTHHRSLKLRVCGITCDGQSKDPEPLILLYCSSHVAQLIQHTSRPKLRTLGNMRMSTMEPFSFLVVAE